MKKWLLLAVLLVVLGATAFTITACNANWDFSRISGSPYQSNVYEFSEEIKDIEIEADTADIVFASTKTDGTKAKVICEERKNLQHTVSLENGVLTIKVVDARKWYEHISFWNERTKVFIELPQSEYTSLSIESSTGDIQIPNTFTFATMQIDVSTGDVTNRASVKEDVQIKTSTGDICVEGATVGAMTLSVTTGDICVEGATVGAMTLSVTTGEIEVLNVTCAGDINVTAKTGESELEQVTCKNLISSGSTGAISLEDVIAAERISIKRSTGDVEFEGCDAPQIYVETTTGDVEGSFLTGKQFNVETATGRKKYPADLPTGGLCEITTSTGDVEIIIR